MKLSRALCLAAVMVAAAGLSADAAQWSFHFTYSGCPGGNLQVWGTVDCQRTDLLFEGYAVNCQTYSGSVPGDPINDIIFDFWWDATCGNNDHIKFALPGWNGDTEQWELGELPPWIDAHVDGSIDFPGLGDPTGTIQEVYIIVNPAVWILDPRPFQSTYTIVNGTCPELPGYLIGTTPIVFNPNAPPGGNPFSTTPLNGQLSLDSELALATGQQVPSVSEWGLIVVTVLLLVAGTIIFAKRRQVQTS
ncbi:MAG TPA: hypothetical protein PKK06_17735 [Phycisphaerae bacterium]|nr:hypothetical protein [Phycisphaerae bacterium]HNU47060.1 hypothetical protein [Phycisphaerae bacterium]